MKSNLRDVKKDLSGILATVWLPPPASTSYELDRITFRPEALDQRLTKYFLTVR